MTRDKRIKEILIKYWVYDHVTEKDINRLVNKFENTVKKKLRRGSILHLGYFDIVPNIRLLKKKIHRQMKKYKN